MQVCSYTPVGQIISSNETHIIPPFYKIIKILLKTKFGHNIKSKSETAQINEGLLKVLCHNICVVIQEMSELGVEPNSFNLNLTKGND
jgi:hypothetical protein